MPHITVFGLKRLELLIPQNSLIIREVIATAVISVEELNLKKQDVSITLHHDSTVEGEADVIIAVNFLFEKPERTFEVRRHLAEAVAAAFKERVCGNDRRKIEVFVGRFNPDQDGFACILPTE